MKHPVRVSVFCLAWGMSAAAATLDGSQSLNAYPALVLQGGTQNVKTNASGCYSFADRNGDGTMTAVVPAGLSLANRNLYTSNGTNIWLNLNGGDLTATSGRIYTYNTAKWGDIIIHNVGAVSLKDGYLNMYNSGNTWETRASIVIGQDGVSGPRAGAIQANGLFANAAGAASQSAGGAITVYSSGDVLIRNDAGVLTNITTYTTYSYSSSGPVAVLHDGTLQVRDVLATAAENGPTGSLLFDGDALSNGATGTFTANILDNHDRSALANDGAMGAITIRGYTDVTIGSVYANGRKRWVPAGSLLITGIVNNIRITGDVNLRGIGETPKTNNGNMRLYAGGSIVVNNLDLTNLTYALFYSGADCSVTGVLANFNTAVPTNGVLDCLSGRRIFYNPKVAGNAYLGAQKYPLKSGGMLKARPQGTVVAFQ